MILMSLSLVFPMGFAQAAAPLTLKASDAEVPKTQAQATAQSGGSSGGKQIDPFRKSETIKKAETRPNMFQDLLDRQVELPSKKRPPAPPKKKANDPNSFEEAEESGNPFGDAEDVDNPFGGNPFGDNPFGDAGSGQFGAGNFNLSNPFAAGDPFADEDQGNQGRLSTAASSGNKKRDPKTDEKEIRDCFTRYKQSILNTQGKVAVEYVDQKTIKFYDEILEQVKSARRPDIEQETFIVKMMILTIRHRVPKETILSMSGKELVIYSVESGMISKDSVAKLELGTVIVNGDVASTTIVSDGIQAPFGFSFVFEGGRWKMNLISFLSVGEKALKVVAQQQKMSENDFIFFLMENSTGKKPTASVWEPLMTDSEQDTRRSMQQGAPSFNAPPGVGVTFGPPTVIPGGFQSEDFDQFVPRSPQKK